MNLMRSNAFAARAAQAPAPGEELVIRPLVDFLVQHRKRIVLMTLLGAVLAYCVGLAMEPKYIATAQVLLEPRKEKIFGQETILPEMNLENGSIDSQVLVVQSTNLLRHVVEVEKLEADPEFGDRVSAPFFPLPAWLTFSRPAPSVRDDNNGPGAPPPHLRATIERFRKAIDVSRVGKTFVMAITVTSRDAAKAARLANVVADAYIAEQLAARYDSAKHASIMLAERLGALREQVRESDEAVAQFRRENNLVATSNEDKVSISEQQLSELNTKLTTARAETGEKRAKYEQAARLAATGASLETFPDVVHSNAIVEMRKQQAEVARREAELVAHYGDRHPAVINTRAERRDIDRSIAAETQRIVSNLKNDFIVAQARETALQNNLANVTRRTGADNRASVRLRELERINAANKTSFENVMLRAKMAHEQSSLEEREARVISPAVTPQYPSSPRKTIFALIGGGAGLALALASAVSKRALSRGYSGPRAIEAQLGGPVLATIPDMRSAVGAAGLEPLGAQPFALDPHSRFSDAMRNLRYGLREATERPKSVLIASSLAREGRTTVALGLASSAAAAGMRALLIDADLRSHSATRLSHLSEKPGLADVLSAGFTVDEAIFPFGAMHVLPFGAGLITTDHLESKRMKAMLEHLKKSFDICVIDVAPCADAADALVLSDYADAVLLVVRSEETDRDLVIRDSRRLNKSGRLAGVALNFVSPSAGADYAVSGA